MGDEALNLRIAVELAVEDILHQATKSSRSATELAKTSRAAIRSTQALLARAVVATVMPLIPLQPDWAAGDILRGAERAFWAQNQAAPAGLRSNHALLMKITGAVIPPSPEAANLSEDGHAKHFEQS